MGKENRKGTFTTEYLQQITNENNSCVERKRDKLHITVHPFQLKDFTASLKDVLSSRVARYNEQLGGILLGYDNIVAESNTGSINIDNCYVHVDLEGDFYVFKPEIGRLLKGVVNKKSRSHVGCLVYQLFNVSLPSPEEGEEWLGDNVTVGQEIVFRIVDTNLNRKLPYIRGEIISILTDSDSGISTSEEKPAKKKKHKHKEKQQTLSTEQEEASPKKRKHKKHSQENEDDEEEIVQETPKSKKEKRSSLNKVRDESVVVEDEEIEVPKKHKKKRHSEGDEKSELVGSKKRKFKSLDDGEEGTSPSVSPKKKKYKRSDCD